MGRAELKIPGGKLIRAQVSAEDGKIRRIIITGDFFLHPEDVLDRLEETLLGRKAKEVDKTIDRFFKENKAVLVGVKVRDFTKVILDAWHDQAQKAISQRR
ncbi:MAG: lipoate protein ligase C-terminal domain-containing protein [Promethearchaeota archaeon]